MNKPNAILAALCCIFILTGCGILNLPAGEGAETAAEAPVGSTDSGKSDIGSILGSVLGSLGVSTSTSITGTWVYQEPSVQFTSDNLLAKAGGVKAGAEAAKKLAPYYEKVGIKPGKMSIAFKVDNTVDLILASRKLSGTYEYDKTKGQVSIHSSMFALPTAYVTIVGNQLSLTFDSSMILSLVQMAGSLQGVSASLAAVSQIAESFDGMKTGFLLVK